jgi:pyruvate formate-lyase activating enzyme-like uncharacterized protein
MKIISRDYVISEKTKRRSAIKELEYHAHGDCIHIGKISRGCKTCFVRNNLSSFAIYTGCECNLACGYCYYEKSRSDKIWNTDEKIRNNLADFYASTIHRRRNLQEVSYNSWGETLMYPSIIEEASSLLKKYEIDNDKKVYTHLYTNGTLADEKMLSFLKSCNIIELRFHMSASSFSTKVKGNMELAKSMGFIISVEEPSILENKDKLFEALPFLNSIGLNHLNLVECQVTSDNKQYLERKYPESKIYRDNLWHLYDEGMVYDIMEEVIKNKYSFSVIDCNSRVEVCRESNQITRIPELTDYNMMEGACNEVF